MGLITDAVVRFRPKGGHTSVDTNVRYVPEAVIGTHKIGGFRGCMRAHQ
jgi:hypothetical protein